MRWHLLAGPLAAVAFVVNPNLGCGGAGDEFEFGATEMRALAEGTWDFTVPGETTPRLSVTLTHVAMATRPGRGFVRSAAACESRKFLTAAQACIVTSSMTFGVRVLRMEAPFTAAPTGATLLMFGTKLNGGQLSVGFPEGGDLVVGVGGGAAERPASRQGSGPQVTLTAIRRP
jgi:hypothetical protein